MKSLFIVLSVALLAITSCSDEGNPPKNGEDQVPQPVENTGPETEAQRAVEATVNDSTNTDQKKDSTSSKKDSTK